MNGLYFIKRGARLSPSTVLNRTRNRTHAAAGTSSSAAVAPPALLLIFQHTMNCFSRVDADQKHEANLARKTTTGEKRRARGGEGPGRPTRRPRRRRRRFFLMVDSRKRAELQAAARRASTCSLAGAPLGGPICSARTSGGIRRNAGARVGALGGPVRKGQARGSVWGCGEWEESVGIAGWR